MGYESCPTDVVHAPIDIVWSLLTHPAGWGDFFDVRVIAVNPPGFTIVRQRDRAKSGPRLLSLELTFECTDIDAARHRLGLTRCRVNYHCDFRLPAGWRGAILRIVMRRELDVGPIEASGGTQLCGPATCARPADIGLIHFLFPTVSTSRHAGAILQLRGIALTGTLQ